MRKIAPLIALAAFTSAAALAAVTALFAAGAIEGRSERTVARLLAQGGLDWAVVGADGLLVTLSGTAPTELLRFRALTLAGTVVDAARVIDAMDVTPAAAITAPPFLLELLRNDDGISLIGLVPSGWVHDSLMETVAGLSGSRPLADMLEVADFAVPEGWGTAVDFGMRALALLPRAKISITAQSVEVTAISDSLAHKTRLEAELARAAPDGLLLRLDISAPRPVITPFTLRFVVTVGGARFDACSADTEAARDRILASGVAAGARGKLACTLGLGVPSPRWGEAAEVGIAAVKALGAGTLTISDVDVSLNAPATVPLAVFDQVVGDAQARMPEVFSLKATREEPPVVERSAESAQFTVTRSPEGDVQLRGRLGDARARAVVDAYARARFGSDQVTTATRLEEAGIPQGWTTRVLAAVAALAEVHNGAVLVLPERLEIRGVAGSEDARGAVTQILSERLGQGATFEVDVTYDQTLDLALRQASPAACVEAANGVLTASKIAFAPGATRIDDASLAAVTALADVLRTCPGIALEIGGHTDSQGREETNQRLSEARADAVRSALRERRVLVSSFTVRGYGASEPIADNATEEGREANRRIALRLIADPAVAEVVAPGGETEPKALEGAAAPIPDAAVGVATGADGAAPVFVSAAPKEKTIRPKARPANR